MNKRTLYAFIISFILLVTAIILNRVTFMRMKNYTFRVDHTHDVITNFESLSNNFKSAQIYTTTYPEDSLKNYYGLYKKDADQIEQELNVLKQLVRDNLPQSHRVDSINQLINKHLPLLLQKNVAEIINMGESWRLTELFSVHDMINRGIQNEKRLLITRSKELNNFTRLNNILSITFSFLAISIFIFTFLNSLYISRRRKWLEGFLASILNTSRNGVAHYKAIREHGQIKDFQIEFLNEAIDELLGITAGPLVGKRLSEFPSFLKEPRLTNKFIEVVETGKPVEFEILYKNEKVERWLLVSLVKLDDGITASCHDISQLKNFENELQNKIKELEYSNTELEQYAYIASHDLQEPLRKIRSFGSYLQDTQSNKLDENGQQLLEKIMRSAERMSSLIKDILSFSSLNKQTEYVPVDLNEIVKTVLSDLDLLIVQKNAIIQKDPLPTIAAIPLQMSQLFYNLVNNSLKFAKETEPPVIKISCRIVPPEEKKVSFKKQVRYYEFVISDNGIGFSKEHSDQIFGLFKRLNNSQFYAGSGIGLALCRKVVENHNGEIFATGKENEGASFFVYLPEKQL